MDIDQPPLIAVHECPPKDAHKSGQYDQVGAQTIDLAGQFSIKLFTAVELSVVNNPGRQAKVGSCGQPGRVGPVADDAADLGRPLFILTAARNTNHIRSAARDQNGKLLHRREVYQPPVTGKALHPLSAQRSPPAKTA